MAQTQPNPSNLTDSFSELLGDLAQNVNRVLEPCLSGHSKLHEINRYGVLNGGKRFRAFLTVSVADLYKVKEKQSLRAAAAVELAHAYSLIHDDLPAMDNSDLRRGKPSCHIQYDEPSAILAGDSLIPLAFEVLGSPETHPDPQTRLELILRLAQATGPQGMPLGQLMDLGLDSPVQTVEDLIKLESLKTGELFSCACEMGAILGGARKEELEALRNYGHKIGLVFQIVDDLLDTTSNPETLGKPARQDQAIQKTTFISILGLDATRGMAEKYVEEAAQALNSLPPSHQTLLDAAHFALSRIK